MHRATPAPAAFLSPLFAAPKMLRSTTLWLTPPPTLSLVALVAAAVVLSPLLLLGAIVLGATGVPADLNGENHDHQASL